MVLHTPLSTAILKTFLFSALASPFRALCALAFLRPIPGSGKHQPQHSSHDRKAAQLADLCFNR